MIKYSYVFVTLVFVTYGQIIIKYRVNKLGPIKTSSIADMMSYFYIALTDVGILSGLMAAGIAALAWISAMSKFELSSVYPLLSINFVLVPLLSYLFFDEMMNYYKVVGIAIIIIGILIFSKGI